MTKILSLCLPALLFLCLNLSAQGYYDDRIEVTVTSDELHQTIQQGEASWRAIPYLRKLTDKYHIKLIQKYPGIEEAIHELAPSLTRVYELHFEGKMDQLIHDLQTSRQTFFHQVERLGILQPTQATCFTSDPTAPWNDRHLVSMRAREAFCLTEGSPNVRIAIIECCNGFLLTHEDLVTEIVHDNNDQFDPSHGTYVAGAAAAATDNGIGIASPGFDSRLILIGRRGFNGFMEAYNNGADIINCSWIGGMSQNDRNLVNMLTDLGVIIIAAAGNGNFGPGSATGGYSFPASADNVISVSATNNNLCIENTWCCLQSCGTTQFATHNDMVDILAPGFCVYSTTSDPWLYDIWGTGTSMASPLVAGVVGLMLSVNPCLNHDDIVDILQTTGQNVSAVCNNANYYPNSPVPPFIDAHAAVQEAENRDHTNIIFYSSDNFPCTGDVVTISATDIPGINYQWQVTGGSIWSGQGTSSITVQWGYASGMHTVTLVAIKPGCTPHVVSRQYYIVYCGYWFKTSPNPANAHFELTLEEDFYKAHSSTLFTAEILGIDRQPVRYEKFSGSKVSFNTSDLKDGLYYIRLNNGKEVQMQPIVISH